MDIHEQHLDYLKKCCGAYQELVDRYGWKRISCTRDGKLRSIEAIGIDVAQAAAAVMK